MAVVTYPDFITRASLELMESAVFLLFFVGAISADLLRLYELAGWWKKVV